MLWVILLSVAAATSAVRSYPRDRCEPIIIPMCKDIAYNQTIFPNLMGNQNQDDAAGQIHNYQPLVKIKCSADIQLFLCSMFAPVCTILEEPLKPCRDLCESAREGCERLMNKFGYDWPAAFDCSRFPNPESELCMHKNSSRGGNNPLANDIDIRRYQTSTPSSRIPDRYEDMMDFICPGQLEAPKDLAYSLKIGSVTAQDCGAPCDGMFFDKSDIDTFRILNKVCSWIAMTICLFTIATYFVDRQRFPYPQMAIIHMSICHFMITVLYIWGSMSGDAIACGQPFETNKPNLEPERLIRQGIEEWRCSVIGSFLYFFTMAAALWWVIFTMAWFLSAGFRWVPEAFDSSYMHTIVWTVSSIQTLLVMVFKKIGGDVLSGVCYVGLWDSHTLLISVIIPLVLYHVIGLVCLIMGFVCFTRVYQEQSKAGAKTEIITTFMWRIGKITELILP